MSDSSVAHVHLSHKIRPFYQAPGHPIAYFPSLAPHVGGTNAAMLLCQLLYWTTRTRDPEGWIYKSQLELIAETGMSRDEQRTARKALTTRGLIEERYDRLNHRLWFRVNVEAYNALIHGMYEAIGASEDEPKPLKVNQIRKTYMGKYGKRISGYTKIVHRHIRKSYIAKDPETTAEITLEITSEKKLNVANVGIDRDKPSTCQVDHVGSERHKPTRRLRLTARQEELVEVLEEQFEDTHSRGAFCRIVSDAGLGEEIAARILRETLEQERSINGPLGAYFIDACQREAQRQGIDLGFKGQASRGFSAANPAAG
jgi:hypothetical protein